MSDGENIPHVENVRLIRDSRSHAGVPGFSSRFAFVFSLGLLVLFLLAYFVFG